MSKTHGDDWHPSQEAPEHDAVEHGFRRGTPNSKDIPLPVDVSHVTEYLKSAKFEPRSTEDGVISEMKEMVELHFKRFDDEYDLIKKDYESPALASIRDIDRDTGEVVVTDVVDWSAVTSNHAETVVWRLSKLADDFALVVSDFHVQAQLAYSIWDDSYWQYYKDLERGTVNDRIAYARSKTMEERYQYIYLHYLHGAGKARLERVDRTRATIDFTTNRRSKSS